MFVFMYTIMKNIYTKRKHYFNQEIMNNIELTYIANYRPLLANNDLHYLENHLNPTINKIRRLKYVL